MTTAPVIPTAPKVPYGIGLRARASLAVLVLVVAVGGLATVVVKRSDSALHDVERARFEAAAAQLADTVSYGVLANSAALLNPALDAFAKNPDLAHVDVTGDGGALLSAREGPAQHVEGGRDVVEVRARVVTRAAPPGDDGELAAFGVADLKPRDVGEVRAVFSSQATADIQKRTRREIVLAALGLGLFGLLVSGALMTNVVRRVRRVADAAAKVRGGARDVVVVVDGADELTQLAADFNQMTRALDDAAQALAERESLAAIGRATAVIAHELKNPLGIVLGAAQIVGNVNKPLEARALAAGIVEEEVRRLSRTLEDLLSYARPRAPEQRSVDVKVACEQAATRALHAGGPMHGKSVAVDAHSSAAGAARGAFAFVDEGHVQQILLNLVQNAAQAGAHHVTLRLVVEPDVVRVHVVDDGPGVAQDMREQLFMPFATNKQRGTGLGLAASRRLARDNGGDLEYVDGARFVLTLPLDRHDRKKASP